MTERGEVGNNLKVLVQIVRRNCEGIVEEVEGLDRMIRRNLARCSAMRVGELCLRLGLNEDVVRPELERMKVRREVARLRVVGGGGEDFYRLCDTGLGQIPAAEVVFTDDPMTCMIAQQNPNNGLTLR